MGAGFLLGSQKYISVTTVMIKKANILSIKADGMCHFYTVLTLSNSFTQI